MTFTPYAGKVEIEPMQTGEKFIMSDREEFPELGRVIQVGEGVGFVKPGDVIFFIAYGMEQTPDFEGKTHYVVSMDSRFVIGKAYEDAA
jgi:hypothetical protein